MTQRSSVSVQSLNPLLRNIISTETIYQYYYLLRKYLSVLTININAGCRQQLIQRAVLGVCVVIMWIMLNQILYKETKEVI